MKKNKVKKWYITRIKFISGDFQMLFLLLPKILNLSSMNNSNIFK